MAKHYDYIRAWYYHLGSYPYYIDDQVEKARKENAPANAIYRDDTEGWITLDDITENAANVGIKRRLEEYVDQIRAARK